MNVTAAAPSMRRAVRRASPAAVSTKVRSNRDARPDRVRRVRKTLDRRAFSRFRTLFVTGPVQAFLRGSSDVEATRARDAEKNDDTVFSFSSPDVRPFSLAKRRLTRRDPPRNALSRK